MATQGAGGPPAGRPGAAGSIREYFNRFDRDRDGKLTMNELTPPAQRDFARLDANSDGAVTEEEFQNGVRVLGRLPGTMGPRELEAMFDRTDSNSDGKLTKDEVPEDRQFIRRIFDQVGSDSISKEQFVRAMDSLGPPGGLPGAPGRRPDGAPRPEGAMPGGPPPGAGLFALLDTDRDGQLSTSEIVAAGTTLLKLDRNGDGKLTPDEAFNGPGGPPPWLPRPGEGRPAAAGNTPRPPEGRPGPLNPEAMRERFKEADANKDGRLSKDEAPDFLKERFDRLDGNSDGFLDETELLQAAQRLQGNPARPALRRPDGARPGAEQPKPENK